MDAESIKYALVYSWQSLQKLVLTEGDRLVLWTSETLINQGIYATVNNLG